MPLSERKIPVSDDVVAARLAAGVTQVALAEEYAVSRRAIRNARARADAVHDDARGAVHRRNLELRRTRRRQGAPSPARAPEHARPASATATAQPGPARRQRGQGGGGRILPAIPLDGNFNPVAAGSDYEQWLNDRDFACSRTARKLDEREIAETRARVEQETGMRWDPLANDGHGAYIALPSIRAADAA